MSAPRVAIVGARRVRQGLGPFVARFLAAEGAAVPAFLGTSASSVALAADELERTAGIRPRGFTDLGDLLSTESVDALAILSPAETHERYLEAALDARLHVLCEKPLVWGGADLARRARELWEGFVERGLLLVENCQWPRVLPAFRTLHPDRGQGPPRTFAMRLTPSSRGEQMIGDALPHPLSVLQALAPSGEARIESLAPSTRAPGAGRLVLELVYRTPEHAIESRVELESVGLGAGRGLPREASLTMDGATARRRVRMEDYALFLATGGSPGAPDREVPLADPLRGLLRDFVEDLVTARRGRVRPADPAVPQRMEMIELSLQAFREDPR